MITTLPQTKRCQKEIIQKPWIFVCLFFSWGGGLFLEEDFSFIRFSSMQLHRVISMNTISENYVLHIKALLPFLVLSYMKGTLLSIFRGFFVLFFFLNLSWISYIFYIVIVDRINAYLHPFPCLFVYQVI